LKLLPARLALGALLLAAVSALLLVTAASLPRLAERPATPPRVLREAHASGPLSAGVADVRFELPPGVPVGGFARLLWGSEGTREPVGVRALALSVPGLRIVLVSAELLLVPEALETAVLARVSDLDLTGVVVAATHTHAGPGGFWEHALGERVATGPYDPLVRDAVAAAIARAIRQAVDALAPARVSIARGLADDLARSRSGGAEEGRILVVRVDRPDGSPVAELAVFPAHPTILGKENRLLSGDWPGRFLAKGDRGLRLFFQGALGDQSVGGSASGSPEAFAASLSARVDALPRGAPDAAPALGYAAVETSLPAFDPGAVPWLLRRAARNLGQGAFPSVARVEALRIGGALLIALPAEPVASVAAGWRAALPPGAEIVSLAGGYLGYVEAPERVRAGEGETVRTYFGPDLARRLGEATRAAAEAAGGTRAP